MQNHNGYGSNPPEVIRSVEQLEFRQNIVKSVESLNKICTDFLLVYAHRGRQVEDVGSYQSGEAPVLLANAMGHKPLRLAIFNAIDMVWENYGEGVEGLPENRHEVIDALIGLWESPPEETEEDKA